MEYIISCIIIYHIVIYNGQFLFSSTYLATYEPMDRITLHVD